MKTFTFKYDPEFTPGKMFQQFKQAIAEKKQTYQPNLITGNSIEAILGCMTKNRLELFSCLVSQKPGSLQELAQLLGKDYANV
jgi:predicted transcriptional regulator